MELTIYNKNDTWTAYMGDVLNPTKIHPLVPSSQPLLRLVNAIHLTHPESKVWLATQISNNPYLANHIVHSRWMRMVPDYAAVQRYLDHPQVKICNMCECEAFYNDIVHTWQCVGCNRVSFRDEPRFFKLSRHAKNQGGNAFRTREDMVRIVAKKNEIKLVRELAEVERLKKKYNLVER